MAVVESFIVDKVSAETFHIVYNRSNVDSGEWMKSVKKICVINTGGTLSMRRSESGYRPWPGYLANQMANMDELSQSPMPEFDIIEHEPLVDSSNMTPDIWSKIANDIQEHHDAYDGFVVLHGTDTMAYSAAALAFMLDGLARPVILTVVPGAKIG